MADELWDCICGKTGLKGKFCTGCGRKRELSRAKDERIVKLFLGGRGAKSDENGQPMAADETTQSRAKEREQNSHSEEKGGAFPALYELLKNKKQLIPVILICAVLLVILGCFLNKQDKNEGSMSAGAVLLNNNVKKELCQEALLSKSEQGINEFNRMLNEKNEKKMVHADGLIWITTKVYKQGPDVFVEGAYFNGTNVPISFTPEMKMDIFFYAAGKEIGRIKNETFDKVQIRNLGNRKKKNIRYKIEGKAGIVGDFSTFLVMTKFK